MTYAYVYSNFRIPQRTTKYLTDRPTQNPLEILESIRLGLFVARCPLEEPFLLLRGAARTGVGTLNDGDFATPFATIARRA